MCIKDSFCYIIMYDAVEHRFVFNFERADDEECEAFAGKQEIKSTVKELQCKYILSERLRGLYIYCAVLSVKKRSVLFVFFE